MEFIAIAATEWLRTEIEKSGLQCSGNPRNPGPAFLTIPSISVARLDFRLGVFSAIRAQGASDVIALFELTLAITPNVTLICSSIDKFPFACATFRCFIFHVSFFYIESVNVARVHKGLPTFL